MSSSNALIAFNLFVVGRIRESIVGIWFKVVPNGSVQGGAPCGR